jgi:hypothetical protein
VFVFVFVCVFVIDTQNRRTDRLERVRLRLREMLQTDKRYPGVKAYLTAAWRPIVFLHR